MSEVTPQPVDRAAPAVAASPARGDRAALRRAAEAFEAMLVQTLVRRMAEAQLEEGFFGGGAGSSVYEGLFEQHLSEGVAGRSPLGIADMLEARWTASGSAREAEQALGLLENGAALDAVLDSPAGPAGPQVFPLPADEKFEVEGRDVPGGGQR